MSSADLIKTLAPYAAVIAASITGCVAIFQWWANGRRQERDRKQETFAAAYEVCAEYAEMPYAIRRRRTDVPAEERVRLSEQVRAIQVKLTRYEAWVHFESATVGAAYQELVRKTREHAGVSMKQAWQVAGAKEDSDMVISTSVVDLRALAVPRVEYMNAVDAYLRRRYPRVRLSFLRIARRPATVQPEYLFSSVAPLIPAPAESPGETEATS